MNGPLWRVRSGSIFLHRAVGVFASRGRSERSINVATPRCKLQRTNLTCEYNRLYNKGIHSCDIIVDQTHAIGSWGTGTPSVGIAWRCHYYLCNSAGCADTHWRASDPDADSGDNDRSDTAATA